MFQSPEVQAIYLALCEGHTVEGLHLLQSLDATHLDDSDEQAHTLLSFAMTLNNDLAEALIRRGANTRVPLPNSTKTVWFSLLNNPRLMQVFIDSQVAMEKREAFTHLVHEIKDNIAKKEAWRQEVQATPVVLTSAICLIFGVLGLANAPWSSELDLGLCLGFLGGGLSICLGSLLSTYCLCSTSNNDNEERAFVLLAAPAEIVLTIPPDAPVTDAPIELRLTSSIQVGLFTPGPTASDIELGVPTLQLS